MKKEDVLFPFEEIRKIQDELISTIATTIKNKENLVVHAPTGLGKTVSALGPALKKAEEDKLTVFFLTSRHTQHQIALETLNAIKEKYDLSIPVIDIIGKKWMCLQPSVTLLQSNEFSEYCKNLKEGDKCEFFSNLKKGSNLSLSAKSTLESIEIASPLGVQEVIDKCEEVKLCPYEMSLLLSKKAKVVIADYYYLFNPAILMKFLNKAEKGLDECIVIVDEAHNLPNRIRELMTHKVSTLTIKGARKEADELKADDCFPILDELQEKLLNIIGLDEEKIIRKGEFKIDNKNDVIDLFDQLADETILKSKRSYLRSIALFLEHYEDAEDFVNIIRHVVTPRGERIELTHSCLDPSVNAKTIFENCHSSILMSGTLTPAKMYQEVLGIKGKVLELPSPFPKKNKLNLIVPQTTTKYSERSLDQFKNIAAHIAKITNIVPGNSVVFFPSYSIRDQVYAFLSEWCEKTVFNEVSGMSKQEKEDLLERFKSYKDNGAVLLGVASGSFGEGIDLPGDLLKCVVIVGLPLNKPDLETQALIDHYDRKYSKGWDYGYVLPAISKVFQNAGRCIRSETDKGLVVFLDKRYAWPNYKKCFSEDVEMHQDFEERIEDFFS
ncbi:ATP-dependent DNA helicase [Candidatus Woesearchaeota archaeon]|jgi:DNA excision repair protein ERCC-2|nr:ATP-dependent DNA helicase [Candidatus Woesearchaeota archaeon]MBT4368008.1 ATP-dependent DNA helicase [Candidatus Woesearchaeota archaeon]MBT4712496.1 ATP-dependent DNA helicase [Candidatus Woesearchaeota archaeon]MBT6639409.1 ATP-dependent DNA helicase [Candidatus Woesearchaeota archaeon]MBT7133581.1 ATP-dependent DNA helicase [Candidatus Woesearchaeota archaeon]